MVISHIAKVALVKPTNQLRWNKGVLEQGYEVTEYEAGSGIPTNTQLEWRVVPTVDQVEVK